MGKCLATQKKPVEEPPVVAKIKPEFEFFDTKLMILYSVDADCNVKGRQDAKHKVRPLHQLSVKVSDHEYAIVGGYSMHSDYLPIRSAELFDTTNFTSRPLPDLPLSLHGGKLYCFQRKLFYIGAWMCESEQTEINVRRQPWPYGNSTLQFWKNVESVAATALLTLTIGDPSWRREKFSSERVSSSSANPLELIAPGTCEYKGQLLFVGGYWLHNRQPSRKFMLFDPLLYGTKRLQGELPKDEGFLMPLVAPLGEDLLVINVHGTRNCYRLIVETKECHAIRLFDTLLSSELSVVCTTPEFVVFSCTKYAAIFDFELYEVSTVSYSTCKLAVVGLEDNAVQDITDDVLRDQGDSEGIEEVEAEGEVS